METYKNSKLKPLSIALAVRHKTGQIIGAKVATMNCHGRMASISREFYGLQADTRAQAFRDVLRNIRLVAQTKLTIATDGKDAYSSIIKKILPTAEHAIHVNPKRKRNTEEKKSAKGKPSTGPVAKKEWDPLYRLNQTAAKLRANISRLARKTWSGSKLATRLEDHLDIYIAFNNGYVLT